MRAAWAAAALVASNGTSGSPVSLPVVSSDSEPTVRISVWPGLTARLPASITNSGLNGDRPWGHVTLVRLPDLGHVPFEEDPDRSLGPVERFLAE